MPCTDILNPTPTHPLNPDYSFQRKRPVTHLSSKASRGPGYFRDLTDVAHSWLMSWTDRPLATADRLKWYYEQYLKGFFTYIDHEGGGRQYVGHFVTPIEPGAASHNHWFAQMIQFDEIPTVPMMIYPGRWDKDAIWELLVTDYSDVQAAVSGSWLLVANAVAQSDWEFQGTNANTTDWAALQYKGYGFQFWARTGPNMGIAQIVLDGIVLGNVDFYSAVASPGAVLLYTALNVSLGIHVVQINATNTKNVSSTAKTIVWDALKVMR